MNIHDAKEKNVRIKIKGGREITGFAWYTSALDNPEGKQSLSIGDLIIFEDEIESIDEVNEQ